MNDENPFLKKIIIIIILVSHNCKERFCYSRKLRMAILKVKLPVTWLIVCSAVVTEDQGNEHRHISGALAWIFVFWNFVYFHICRSSNFTTYKLRMHIINRYKAAFCQSVWLSFGQVLFVPLHTACMSPTWALWTRWT